MNITAYHQLAPFLLFYPATFLPKAKRTHIICGCFKLHRGNLKTVRRHLNALHTWVVRFYCRKKKNNPRIFVWSWDCFPVDVGCIWSHLVGKMSVAIRSRTRRARARGCCVAPIAPPGIHPPAPITPRNKHELTFTPYSTHLRIGYTGYNNDTLYTADIGRLIQPFVSIHSRWGGSLPTWETTISPQQIWIHTDITSCRQGFELFDLNLII
jgi:hypothetical protein